MGTGRDSHSKCAGGGDRMLAAPCSAFWLNKPRLVTGRRCGALFVYFVIVEGVSTDSGGGAVQRGSRRGWIY